MRDILSVIALFAAMVYFGSCLAGSPSQEPQKEQYERFQIMEEITTTASHNGQTVKLTIPAGAIISVLAVEEKSDGKIIAKK